jgi:hypothetical protein
MTLSELKQHNALWFDKGNKRFFGDVSYKVLHSKVTGKPYLVRSTYAWTDMFGAAKRLHYRINPINGFEIGPLVDKKFKDLDAVKFWLRIN